ncbi:hypothetical protein [Bacillus sp. PS06]|uniref:hypothetical protein n=1 Tax=Bacillus sp. PS06 TaxID=2764176 RepID=UPI00177C20F7|nr:hypothetical protein [Bacillus sp. PS06]MBD8067497.1 hypothetical protein [Bacillus sp. PS06]
MGKRKPQEIHVDKLIIHANEVQIIDEGRNKGRWDPWLGRVQAQDMEVETDTNVIMDEYEKVEVDVEAEADVDVEKETRRPFSWF